MVSAARAPGRAVAVARAAPACLLLACALGARAAPAPYYIESEFQPPRAYVGAEVTLRLRLLLAPGVPYGVLRPPRLGDDAELIPLGTIRAYEITRAGARYGVRERSYVVVPRRAGKLVLPGPELEGPLRHAKDIVRATRGADHVLLVRPPRTAPGAPWLPARRLALEESWSLDPGALAAGQPVVRTLVVRAEGITGNRLPALRMAEQPGLSVHHEASRFSSEYLEAGMAGRRVQRVVLIARDEGEIELPGLSLEWWDIVADEPRVAALPARRIRVGESVPARAEPPPPAEMAPVEVMRWFAVVLFALSAASLWLYARRQPEREAKKRLRAACVRGNAEAARGALIEWSSSVTQSSTAPVLPRLGDAWDERARAALRGLDAALYGGKPWDGREFWRALKPWLRRRGVPRRKASPAHVAPRLYRLQP